MTDALHQFVPPESLSERTLTLEGADAERLYVRGARRGDTIVVLDDSGWAVTVRLLRAAPERCEGAIEARALADEPRTKVSLYQGLLHPADFRRLLTGATALGVVAFYPTITDGSVVPMLTDDGAREGEHEWPRLIREAAEAAGRGRRPALHDPMLLGQALDTASRGGARVLVVDPRGEPLDDALADRPFSIALFSPPPGGFTAGELGHAAARGARMIPSPAPSRDPAAGTLALLEALYRRLESRNEA